MLHKACFPRVCSFIYFCFSVLAFIWRPKRTVSDQRFLWKLLLCNSTILRSYTLETWMYDCSFSWARCLIINAMLFQLCCISACAFIIFSLILRSKGQRSVILFQLLVPDSPDSLYVSKSRARRSGKHRLLLSLQAARHSILLNIPSWAVEQAFFLSLSSLPFLFSPVLLGIPLCPHG